MYLHTCKGCKFSGDCEHAKAVRSGLKGFGVRSVKFACAKRENIFAAGQAVVFTTYITNYVACHYGYMQSVMEKVQYPGYAIGQVNGKVFGYIAKGTDDLTGGIFSFEPRGNGYVKIPLSRTSADDTRQSGDARQCKWCGNHPGLGAPCGKDPKNTPAGECLAECRP